MCKVLKMRLKNLLIVFILCVLASTATSQVVLGVKARDDEFKYLVYIEVNYTNPGIDLPTEFYGGGVIVNEKWILTVAHNFENRVEDNISYPPDKIIILAGTKNIDSVGEHTQKKVVDMSAVISHQNFIQDDSDSYDIALIFLGKDTFNFRKEQVERALLVDPNLDIPVNTRITIVGWGVIGVDRDGEEIEPDSALKGNLNLIPDEKCENLSDLGGFDRNYHLCYGCLKGICSMTAEGDSGSPVVMVKDKSEIVIGISQGGCTNMPMPKYCTPETPGAGMDIRKFRGWMNDKMQEREAKFAEENAWRWAWLVKAMGYAGVAATGAFAIYYNYR